MTAPDFERVAKESIAARRELRLSRQKTAATLLPWFLTHWTIDGVTHDRSAISEAVKTADLLLLELARTEKPQETP